MDDNKPLKDILTKPKPDAQAIFNYEPVLSQNEQNPLQSIVEVQTDKKDFAITSLADDITDKLEKKQVAYDGLLVYVDFSKQGSVLANGLGGKISLEQLRQIFTKKITNWQQIDAKLPNIDIKPYAPTDPNSRALVFFDEMSAAPPSVQVATYQIILNRKIGTYTLPKDVVIVAAGNRVKDMGVAFNMPSALRNRFTH